MTVNGNRVLSFSDLVKGLDPKGNFEHRIVDMVAKRVDILDDMTWIAANDGTSLVTTMRTEIPKAAWAAYYGGIPANKGSKAKIRVSSARLAAKVVIDKQLFDDSKDKDALLMDEISTSMTGMKNTLCDALFYGKLAENPLGFNGLFHHYAEYGNDTVDDLQSAHYVINGKISGVNDDSNLGSIMLVGWNPNTITAFHPEIGTAGIKKETRRTTDMTDPDNGQTFPAYVQELYWHVGLAVRDHRHGGRICNIQRNHMLDSNDTAKQMIELVQRLTMRVMDDGVKQALYMDKLMFENLATCFSRLTMANAVTFHNLEQRKERRLFGIPVRLVDSLRAHESLVPAFAG